MDESELDESDEEDLSNQESATESSADLYLISLSLLEAQLNATSVCKECHSDLKILDDKKKRQGLGASWEIFCTNDDCPSKGTKNSFPISPKDGRAFAINRKAVIAFRLIGKGYSAARKFCSVLGLPEPINRKYWREHTKIICEKAEDVLQKSFEKSVNELKEFKEESEGLHCEDGTARSVATSFDGSWGSWGWTSRTGLFKATSSDINKVIEVEFHDSYVCKPSLLFY